MELFCERRDDVSDLVETGRAEVDDRQKDALVATHARADETLDERLEFIDASRQRQNQVDQVFPRVARRFLDGHNRAEHACERHLLVRGPAGRLVDVMEVQLVLRPDVGNGPVDSLEEIIEHVLADPLHPVAVEIRNGGTNHLHQVAFLRPDRLLYDAFAEPRLDDVYSRERESTKREQLVLVLQRDAARQLGFIVLMREVFLVEPRGLLILPVLRCFA